MIKSSEIERKNFFPYHQAGFKEEGLMFRALNKLFEGGNISDFLQDGILCETKRLPCWYSGTAALPDFFELIKEVLKEDNEN